MTDRKWPAWYNGPDGKTAIFESADAVPAGWTTGAERLTAKGEKAPAAVPTSLKPVPATAPANGTNPAIDAEGWPFDPALHAATATKTQAGLWRMKVGVKRPAAKPGFPKPVFNL
jgi:hypothetical protein